MRKNTITGKCYVGQTHLSIRKRWVNSIKKAFETATMKRITRTSEGDELTLSLAILKYGVEPWEHYELALHENLVDALRSEQHFIKELNTMIPHGYNSTEGGEIPPHGYTIDNIVNESKQENTNSITHRKPKKQHIDVFDELEIELAKLGIKLKEL